MTRFLHPQSADIRSRSANFGQLMHRLQQIHSRRGGRLFATTAAETGAGISSCANALARSCAESPGFGAALFVDLNPRQTSTEGVQETERGWLDWLGSGTSEPLLDRVQRDAASDFHVLPRGQWSETSALPWDFQRLQEALLAFDGIVILSCPPWFDGPVSAAICASVDGVLVVIESERSRRLLVRQMVEDLRRLERDGGPELLGVVLDQRRYPIPQWLYRQLF